MKGKIGLALVLPLLLWGGGRIYQEVVFDQRCGGYIERAAHSNAIETARVELKRAIEYLEQERITQGYTSVLWITPDEDVAFWYANLKAGLVELEGLAAESTPLEQSNVLMRVREALSRTPPGISLYPHNNAWFVFGWLSLFAGIVGCGFLFVWVNDKI